MESVALFEDIETALKSCEGDKCQGDLPGVEYFSEDDVSTAYSNAA